MSCLWNKLCMTAFIVCFIIAAFMPASSAVSVPVATAISGASAATWTFDDMMQLASVTDVCPSPDGSRIVYTVTRPLITETKNELHSQAFEKSPKGGYTIPLMSGDASSSLPKWSPGGTLIAFLSDRSGVNNIWIKPSMGGTPEQITDMENPVLDLGWSPDGKTIAFTMMDPVTEEEKKRVREKEDRQVAGETLPRAHLWTVAAQKNAGPKQVVTGDLSVTGFDWAPDGQSIAFSHQKKTAEFKEFFNQDISILNLYSGEIQSFAPSVIPKKNPVYSPDGRQIAFVGSPAVTSRYFFNDSVYVAPVSGGEVRRLARTQNDNPYLIEWSPDQKSLWFTEFRRTHIVAGILPADGSNPIDFLPQEGSLLPFYLNSIALNRKGTMLGFSWQNATTPTEGYVTNAISCSPIRVTSENEKFLKYPATKTKTIRWKSSDGRETEGILTYPFNYSEGKRYPLIVLIHGGPAAAIQENYFPVFGTEDMTLPVPVLSSQGYAVLRPNFRGSSGYGIEYRLSDRNDWGGMDNQDIMAGVDYLVGVGIADPDRLGIMGHSYGGFMTDWVVTRTDRFKAAVSYAGISDLISLSGTGDVPEFLTGHFEVYFWEDYNRYLSHSAIHSVKNITTPVLFIHGSEDQRVPPSQAVELYTALNIRGVPARLVIYPREGHSISEPKHVKDYWKESLDWFNRYV